MQMYNEHFWKNLPLFSATILPEILHILAVCPVQANDQQNHAQTLQQTLP